MDIVINIPNEKSEKLIRQMKLDRNFRECKIIELPKGHGRLIDADYLKDISLVHNFHANNKYFVPYKDRKGYRLRDTEVRDAVINAKTIIEADKESEKPNKSEWQHDHEILKAYSDGANAVLDKIRLDIAQEIIPRSSDKYDWEARWQNMGLRIALKVIGKYKAEGIKE